MNITATYPNGLTYSAKAKSYTNPVNYNITCKSKLEKYNPSFKGFNNIYGKIPSFSLRLRQYTKDEYNSLSDFEKKSFTNSV